MAEPEFTEDERRVLRQATALRELSEMKQWREQFVPLLDEMIAVRMGILSKPLHELPEEYQSLDFAGRCALLEHIKGALIGLRLVRDLPTSLLNHARQIREANMVGTETETSDE